MRLQPPHRISILQSLQIYPLPGGQRALPLVGAAADQFLPFPEASFSNLAPSEDFITDNAAFLAPEVADQQIALPSNDVFSCGCLMFELLTGRALSGSAQSVSEGSLSSDLESFSRRRRPLERPPSTKSASSSAGSTSAFLDRIEQCLTRCLDRDIDKRYGSLNALLFDLLKIIQSCETEQWDTWNVGAADRHSRFALPTKPVCREVQLDALDTGLRAVVTLPQGQCMTVWGPSGSGKTMLVSHWISAVNFEWKDRFTVAIANLTSETQSPISSFLQIFHQLIDFALDNPEQDANRWRERISNTLGSSYSILLALLPKGDRDKLTSDPSSSLDMIEWPNILNAFKRWCRGFLQLFASSERKLVIILEDVTWMPHEEKGIWRSLLEGVRPLENTFVVVTMRTASADPPPKSQLLCESSELLPVPYFTETDVQTLVVSCLQAPFDKLSVFTRLIFTETEGSPLHLVTLIRSLVRSSCIFDKDVAERTTGCDWRRLL